MIRRLRHGPIYGPKTAAVLLVGEAPSKKMHDREVWHHALMHRGLAGVAGVEFPGEWFRLFARTNLLSGWPGRTRSGKGDLFPLDDARVSAMTMGVALTHYQRVVLLGRRVEKAFGVKKGVWLAWRDEFDTVIAVAPHPSRVNRWWNDTDNYESARCFWKSLADFARLDRERRRSGHGS